jgi:hypothetical protein
VNRLKAKLAIKQVDLEAEHQGHQNSEEVLRAQVVESEKRKEDALAALKEASEKSDDLKRDFEGIRVLLYFLSLSVGFLIFVFGITSSLEEKQETLRRS